MLYVKKFTLHSGFEPNGLCDERAKRHENEYYLSEIRWCLYQSGKI